MSSPQPDQGRYGFWTVRPSGIEFPKPGGDMSGTPIFDQLWSETVGRHTDADGNGIADHAEENSLPARTDTARTATSTETVEDDVDYWEGNRSGT